MFSKNRKDIENYPFKFIVRFNPKYWKDVSTGFELKHSKEMKGFKPTLKVVKSTDKYGLNELVEFDSVKKSDIYPTFYIGLKKESINYIMTIANDICRDSSYVVSSGSGTYSIMIDDKDEVFKRGAVWYSEEAERKPIYPISVLSLGRYTDETGFTHKTLTRLKVKHFLFIEPQEEEKYRKWVDPTYCEIVIGEDFSKLGQGGTPMRNFILDYWREKDVGWCWMLDDNIKRFVRNQCGYKKKIESGEVFSSVEDFVNDTEKVGVCSLFDDQMTAKKDPISVNTQCFSCLFINLNTGIDFEFKYNEDHIFSIRNICTGYNTIKFHHFGYRKPVSGSVKGGNTSTIYAGNGYNKKCDETVEYITSKVDSGEFVLKDGKTIKNLIKITSLKGKPRHLKVIYNVLENHSLPLVLNPREITSKYKFYIR